MVVQGGPGQQAAQGAEIIRNRVLLAVHIQAVDAGGVGAHGADPCAAVGGGPGGLLLKAAAHQQGYVVPSNQKVIQRHGGLGVKIGAVGPGVAQ